MPESSAPGFILTNCNYFGYFWNLLLERPLNSHFQGNDGHRSAAAGTFEAYLDHSIIININEFNIPAITLEHRAHLV